MRPEARSPDGSSAGGEIPSEVAARVALVVLDVDGVLTDAGVYLGASEAGGTVELKRFDIQDGLALRLLKGAGIEVAVVSGRVSAASTVRMRELGVELYQDAGARKLPVVEALMARRKIGWDAVAMVGDDLPDLPILRRCGLPVAVANAVPEVAEAALWRTRSPGGRGAVREFARALLQARGSWDAAVEAYLAERDGDRAG